MLKQKLKPLVFGGVGGGNAASEIGLLVLRVTTGLFIAFGHGLGKIPPKDGFVQYLDKLDVPMPYLNAWMAGLGELVGGVMLALGLATRFASAWLIGVFGVATFVAKAPAFRGEAPFWVPAEGAAEPAVLYLVLALTFLLVGSGRTGVDRFLRKN
ncbi:MAG: DoxX family protein [Planctomycetota bacterium]